MNDPREMTWWERALVLVALTAVTGGWALGYWVLLGLFDGHRRLDRTVRGEDRRGRRAWNGVGGGGSGELGRMGNVPSIKRGLLGN